MDAGSSAGDEVARSLRLAEEHRRKAQWHAERAASFARGRLGEIAVARVLDDLAVDGYHRIDDCRWPGRALANIDHVLIGPGGLFVIDAKNWSGRVQVRDGVLRQNGYRREKELQATADAVRAVHGLLPGPLPLAAGALCLCGSADLALGPTTAGVAVVEVDRLVAWVRSHPSVLDPGQVGAAFAALQGQLRPAASSRVPGRIPQQWPGPAVVEPPAAERNDAAARPRANVVAALLARLLLCMFLLDAVGTIVVGGDRVGGLIVGILCAGALIRLERGRPMLTGRLRR